MGTSFETVYDRALITIQDYHLDNVAKNNYNAFVEYLEGMLIMSVPYFDKCMQSLDYDLTSKTFNSTLTNKEINILAEIMVTTWFTSKVQDVVQYELKLTNREFKTFSESQNFKVKMQYLDELREKYSQDVNQYSLSKDSFSKIFNITLT